MTAIQASDVLQNAKRIVIKIGSVLIAEPGSDKIRGGWFRALSEDIALLKEQGREVIIVSSGGVALGRKTLGIPLDTPPSSIPLEQKQAASSIGQFHMYAAYHNVLKVRNIPAAQILLTLSETENRNMHLNARETMTTLLEKNVVPIINENDTVSTEEIRFGDNDRLAVRVAQMLDADAVILFSTIDGLYTENPTHNAQAQHIPLIDEITEQHIKMAGDAVAGLSTGGMKSKIEAAQSALKTGISLIITDGMHDHCLGKTIFNPEKSSTLFLAKNESKANARKRWIGSHMSPKGALIIDDGACNALKNGKSLLPVGVADINGNFERGDVVEIMDKNAHKLALGIVSYSASDAKEMIGKSSEYNKTRTDFYGREELIHRNDMVLLAS